jgi:hypothetical protein
LAGQYRYGPVHGFVQTPAGGNPGSTSRNRPRLGEIGIHDASVFDGEASVEWGPHEVFGGAQIVRLSGRDTLRSSLVSHGVSFPAGANVQSDVQLDSYRIGYRYGLVLTRSANDTPEVTLTPSAAVGLWQFDYRLRSGPLDAARSYGKPTVLGGLRAEWRPGGGRFGVEGEMSGSPPVPGMPQLYSEQVLARYRFLERGRLIMDAGLGVAFEQMYFKDNQRVSNHISADFGPQLLVSLRVNF